MPSDPKPPEGWTKKDEIAFGTPEIKEKLLEAFRAYYKAFCDPPAEPSAFFEPMRRHAHGCSQCGIWWHDDPTCVDATLLTCPAHRAEAGES